MKLIKVISTLALLQSLGFSSEIYSKFNYFGNISATALDSSGYKQTGFQTDNVTNKINLSSYSKLGAQYSLAKDNFQFTAQGTVQKFNSKPKARLTWLNLKYYFDDYSLKAGKMQLPLFMSSDYLDINYIHLWLRAPSNVYENAAFKTYSGIELSYLKTYNDFTLEIQSIPYGTTKDEINTIGESSKDLPVIRAKNINFVSLKVNNEYLNIKMSYLKTIITSNYIEQALLPIYNFVQNNGYGNLLPRYKLKDRKAKLFTVGINYDKNNLIISSEFLISKTNSLIAGSDSYYILAGYRLKSFTPYFILSQKLVDKDFFYEHRITVNNNTANEVKQQLENVLAQGNDSSSTQTIGFKYDYSIAMAFKVQIDRTKLYRHGFAINNIDTGTSSFLKREAGTKEKSVYQATVGFNFAF